MPGVGVGAGIGKSSLGTKLNLLDAIFITINGVDHYLTATIYNKDYYLQYKK